MERKMKKLMKDHGFNSDMQYFEYIVDSFFNGQPTQGVKLFKAMSKAYRIQFIKNVNGVWDSGLNKDHINLLTDNI